MKKPKPKLTKRRRLFLSIVGRIGGRKRSPAKAAAAAANGRRGGRPRKPKLEPHS